MEVFVPPRSHRAACRGHARCPAVPAFLPARAAPPHHALHAARLSHSWQHSSGEATLRRGMPRRLPPFLSDDKGEQRGQQGGRGTAGQQRRIITSIHTCALVRPAGCKRAGCAALAQRHLSHPLSSSQYDSAANLRLAPPVVRTGQGQRAGKDERQRRCYRGTRPHAVSAVQASSPNSADACCAHVRLGEAGGGQTAPASSIACVPRLAIARALPLLHHLERSTIRYLAAHDAARCSANQRAPGNCSGCQCARLAGLALVW